MFANIPCAVCFNNLFHDVFMLMTSRVFYKSFSANCYTLCFVVESCEGKATICGR